MITGWIAAFIAGGVASFFGGPWWTWMFAGLAAGSVCMAIGLP